MTHSKRSKTSLKPSSEQGRLQRRSFLKLLGLGGAGAVTGLAAGAKVLGGTLAPAGTLWATAQFKEGHIIDNGTPLRMKKIKHNEMLVKGLAEEHLDAAAKSMAEAIDRHILGQLHDQLMIDKQISRDFDATPGPATDKVNVHKPRPRTRQAEGSGIAVFKNGDMESVITISESNFEFTRQRDIIWDHSGWDGFTTCREGDELPLECNLTGAMESVRGVSLRDVLHAGGPFDLELVQGGNKYTFKDCWWTALDYDMTEAYFDVQFTCQGEQTVTWVE